MNVYVRRNEAGNVDLVSANPYEDENGAADEVLAGDDPEVIAFLNPPSPVPEEISDRQFFQQLAVLGMITEQEALAAVATGTIPAAMGALIDQMPSGQQFAAQMLISGATIFKRSHPMANMIGGLYGWTAQQSDDLWRAAAAL